MPKKAFGSMIKERNRLKKILGITLGGLHQKILILVLVFLLALIGVFTGVSIYQTGQLGDVVSDTNRD